MNPDAKEFVPAYILKRRQEEAERLGNLTDQMSKVNLRKSDNDKTENGTKATNNGEECKNKDSSKAHSNQDTETSSIKRDAGDNNCTRSYDCESKGTKPESRQHDKKSDNPSSSSSSSSKANHISGDQYYGDENYPEVDDAYLLREGENLCEFNGEEFIIPGDDDCVPPTQAGYDFGNDEDNEDEDVCNAFEEFLGNLPQ